MYHTSLHMVSMLSCETRKEKFITRIARQVSVLHVESQVKDSDAHIRPYLLKQ